LQGNYRSSPLATASSATDTPGHANAAPALTGAEDGIAVAVAALDHFANSARASAERAFGNVVTGSRGEVHLTSAAGTSGLPSDLTFSNNDNGVHAFSVPQNMPGRQTLEVTDTANDAILGSPVVDVLAKSGGGS
jgi:hypothetical protein